VVDVQGGGHAVLLGGDAQAVRTEEGQVLLAELILHGDELMAERLTGRGDGVAVEMRRRVADALHVLVDRVAEAVGRDHVRLHRAEGVGERHVGQDDVGNGALLQLVALEVIEAPCRRRAVQQRDEKPGGDDDRARHAMCPLRVVQHGI